MIGCDGVWSNCFNVFVVVLCCLCVLLCLFHVRVYLKCDVLCVAARCVFVCVIRCVSVCLAFLFMRICVLFVNCCVMLSGLLVFVCFVVFVFLCMFVCWSCDVLCDFV